MDIASPALSPSVVVNHGQIIHISNWSLFVLKYIWELHGLIHRLNLAHQWLGLRLDQWKPCWSNWHEDQQGFFLAALTKCLDFGKIFLYSIQVADTWRKVEEGETEEGQFIFLCSGKKQEKEGDSFVFVQIKEKEELRENKFVRRKLLVLNVSSVIGLLCIYCLSAFLALFCGSELSVGQNALQSYIFSPCVFAAYYEI